MPPKKTLVPDPPTPQVDPSSVDTGKPPLTCTTCGNPVAAGAACAVDGTVAP